MKHTLTATIVLTLAAGAALAQPTLPQLPKVPEVPKLPEAPKAPEAPKLPEVPKIEVPKAEPAMKNTINVTSKEIKNDTQMPVKYTVDGENVSPPLAWADFPAETKEFALIMSDPDAGNFVHWVVYKIPADVKELPEALPNGKENMELTKPLTLTQGTSSFGKVGYLGPAARPGGGVHHYHFKIYALDTKLDLKPGAKAKELEAAMKGHILAVGELLGNNDRPKDAGKKKPVEAPKDK